MTEPAANNYVFLGLVRQGRFEPVLSEQAVAGPLRLTGALLGAPEPESGEISLTAYEGSALMVRGVAEDGWIRSAFVVEHGGPDPERADGNRAERDSRSQPAPQSEFPAGVRAQA